MAYKLGGYIMRAGLIASAYSGRHLRYFALATSLVIIDISMWTRLVLTAESQATVGDVAVALATATAATVAMLLLWRNPLGRTAPKMTTPALRQHLATHHAGHIVAAYIDDPNRSLTADMSQPCGHHRPAVPAVTQSALHAEVVIALSGMAAEEIFSGESGSHVGDDLTRATAVGADMVGRYGMSGSPVSFATTNPSRTTFLERILDDPRTRKELESLLRETKRESIRLMLENRHTIIAIRDALMRNQRLSSARVSAIISEAQETRHSDDQVLVDLRVVSDKNRTAFAATRP